MSQKKLRWTEIKKNNGHQPLTLTCVCMPDFLHIHVYKHMNIQVDTNLFWNSMTAIPRKAYTGLPHTWLAMSAMNMSEL